jgi:TRAP-type C4-dicarboxylate transport system permease small subunit
MESDQRSLTLLGRLISRVVEAQLVICEIIVVLLAVFVSLDAILRWSINWSFLVVDELGGYALVILSFLGMSIALHEGALFRVEALYDRLTAEGRAKLQGVFDIASLCFSLLLLWQVYGLASRSFDRGVVAPTVLLTPLWIPQAFMAVGALTLTLVLVYQLWARFRMMVRGKGPGEGH